MNEQKEQTARDVITNDGEWPSSACEPGPQARRAAAMQEAIQLLAEAVAELRVAVAQLRDERAGT